MAKRDGCSCQIAATNIENTTSNSNGSGEGATQDSSCNDGSMDHRVAQPARKKATGGWPSAFLLLVSHGLAMIAFVGVEVNLVLFSTRVLKQTNAEAAKTFSRWMGTVHFFSLIGAFLSDGYLGRYLTCALFQLIFIIGLTAFSLTTSFLLLKPHGCGKLEFSCDSHSPFEVAMFYVSIYLVALGNGAYEPSLTTFGSDQFEEDNAHESSAKHSFFSYFYVATNLGSLISETILAYIQNLGRWALGFWISTACAFAAFCLFLSGSMRYRHFRPCGNPVSRFCQVIFAAWNKSAIPLSENGLYEVHGEPGATTHGGRKMHHTEKFKCLDHAAIVTPDDKITAPNQGGPHNPWRLCTITQVEEVKCMLHLLPVWLCTITFSGIFIQMVSLFVEQGAAMRTVISNFHIPPASMTIFDIISVSLFIIFYDKLIAPLYTKLTDKFPPGPSNLKKMGIGLLVSIVGMISAGILEVQRQNHAVEGEKELSSLGILWQIPQYVLIGVAEAFVYVGQFDFFGTQAPDGLKSLGIGLCMASTALGSYLCSLIITVVMAITTKDESPGWIPPNLNQGHLDKFFFLMAALTAVELVVYIWFARRYKFTALEAREDRSTEMV